MRTQRRVSEADTGAVLLTEPSNKKSIKGEASAINNHLLGGKVLNWFITGGCGFIGTALIRELLKDDGNMIRVYDNLSESSDADLAALASFERIPAGGEGRPWDARLSLVEADILSGPNLKAAADEAHVFVHLAANTGVPQSVDDPIKDCQTNVLGILNALEAARECDTKRFIFASSGAPLGVQVPPLHEELAPHPASPYGASKLAGEGYCSAYFHCYGVDTVVLRFGNVYGEGSIRKGSVVAKFAKQALAGQKIEIYGDGSQTRDFIHISDLVKAIIAASLSPAVGGEVFQIASAKETTVAELTDLLLRVIVSKGVPAPDIVNGSIRAGDVARNFSDTTKAKSALGWEPQITLEEGLNQTVDYFVSQDKLMKESV